MADAVECAAPPLRVYCRVARSRLCLVAHVALQRHIVRCPSDDPRGRAACRRRRVGGDPVTLSPAFTDTQVSFSSSLDQIERLLEKHGIGEQRYTHLKPTDDDSAGRLIYEFVAPTAGERDRLGVRLIVAYEPLVLKRGRKVKGTTAKMAARALFWMLKAKFDSIDYGIEEFEVAFMPHLITQLGMTFAERPELIAPAMDRPESIVTLALPAPREPVQ